MESSILLFCSLAAIPSGQGGGPPATMAGSSLLQFPVPVGREELHSGQGCFRGWSCCWEVGGTWLVKKMWRKEGCKVWTKTHHTVHVMSCCWTKSLILNFLQLLLRNTAVVQPKLGNSLLLVPKSFSETAGNRSLGMRLHVETRTQLDIVTTPLT